MIGVEEREFCVTAIGRVMLAAVPTSVARLTRGSKVFVRVVVG